LTNLPTKITIIPPDDDGVDIEENTSGSMYIGEILRFKQGHYLNTSKEIVRTEGKTFAFQSRRALWQRWEDEKPVDIRVTLNGQKHPLRSSLGYTDEDEWPAGRDGKPADPWSDVRLLHIIDQDTGESYTFSTSSYTGRLGVTDLMQAIQSYRIQHRGARPVIELSQKPWKGQNGTIMRPCFPIAGWILAEEPF
jgi:hypothetical protein